MEKEEKVVFEKFHEIKNEKQGQRRKRYLKYLRELTPREV